MDDQTPPRDWYQEAVDILEGTSFHPMVRQRLTRLCDELGSPQTVVVYNEFVHYWEQHDGMAPSLQELGEATGLFFTGVGRYHLPKLEEAGLLIQLKVGDRAVPRGWKLVHGDELDPLEELPLPDPIPVYEVAGDGVTKVI